MERAGGGWKTMFSGFARLLSSRRGYAEGVHEKAPRILAIVPQGPNRRLLQAISRDAGWAVAFSETPPNIVPGGRVDVPPIVIFDRALPSFNWREIVGVLAKTSPRPYVILLSPTADRNLWDELERLGGSDVLRTPVTRDSLRWAVERAWLLWRSEQQVRSPV